MRRRTMRSKNQGVGALMADDVGGVAYDEGAEEQGLDLEQPEDSVGSEGLAGIFYRAKFYEDKYRFLQRIMVGLIVLAIIQSSALYHYYTNPPQPKYIAADRSNRIIPIVPLNQPTLSKSALLEYAQEAENKLCTWDYVNYRTQFTEMSSYFVPDGWKDYAAQLDNSGTLLTVINRSMFVSCIPVKGAVIVKEGPLDKTFSMPGGEYRWKMEIMEDRTYTPYGGMPVVQHLIVRLNFVAVSPIVNPKGVALESVSSIER